MNDQNSLPLPIQPPIQTVQSSPAQPIVQTPPQNIELPSQPEIPSPPKPLYKNKIFLISGGVLTAILILFGGYYGYAQYKTDHSPVPDLYPTWTPTPVVNFAPSIDVTYTPEPEKVCNSPLAPIGAGPISKCNYRDSKISATDSQSVYGRIYKVFGVTQIPDLNFHEEAYKGIHIKWTDNQPISTTTMVWLKNAIDILPPYFYQDHPVMAIYSATPEDLQTKGVAPEYLGAIAYASGLNVFIVKDLADGKSSRYEVNQSIIAQTLFHEWTHVVQLYDTLQTFTEDYLSIPGNASVVMRIDPVTKDYAKTAGWVFQDDQYGDSTYAILGTDEESQKQSDYGKKQYVEDMAEAGTYFMLCLDNKISEARIKWWEAITGTNRNTYCPAKF